MENHPIPQNVTGFQFKLIGDMTIKQFVYLATGVVSGWLFFLLPIATFIRLPVSIFFILAGISLAFIPLTGRSIDVMIANFIKSLFGPTQYVYRKTEASSTIHVISPSSRMALKEESSKQVVSNTYNSPIITSQPSTPHIISMKEVSIDTAEKQKEEENESLQEKEKEVEKELRVLSLEKQLQETLAQKEQLAQQVVDLQKKLNLQKKTILAPTILGPKAQTQNASMVPKNMTRDTGLFLAPDSPNIITGIVKDPRGNPLPNILVEIKDQEGNPVRAFKTSLLGRFASATPLSNGVYTIEFEDPRELNKFDAVGLNVSGTVIAPIEIRSIDPREELRKSLFGQQTN